MKGILIYILILTSLIGNITPVTCGSGSLTGYPAALIPDSLKINANAVIREDSSVFTYISAQSTRFYNHRVITVLNKNGDSQAAFVVSYDKLKKITGFSGCIFDAGGGLIRKIKASDVGDYSGSAGYDLFDDVRYRAFEPLVSQYPYTVEYNYEIEFTGSMTCPVWYAFENFNVSTEKTVFRYSVPAGYEFQVRTFNDPEKPVISSDGKTSVYLWKAVNLKAIENEPYRDELRNFVQAVWIAPSDFSYGGYAGKMDSWNNIAAWVRQLNAGRDELGEERVKEIREMVRDLPGDVDKVKKLYNYMQSRTRYFSIQLGIGGYQPIDAKTVDKVGYSDCKGLSNYMKALLKAVGINSYYTLVGSGSDFKQLIPDFPSLQFNHAMLCVPFESDTVWLECTSQIAPFGFLGDHTSDRQVLLIRENDAAIVRTPVYNLADNFQTTNARVVVLPDGNASADVTRKFGGLQFNDWQGKQLLSSDDQKDWIYGYAKLPNFKIIGNSFRQANPDVSESELTLSLSLSSYGSVSGKRLFVPLNLINRSTYIPPKVKNRWSNIIKLVPYIDKDSVEINLPDGMSVEFLPENTGIQSPFGSYTTTITRAGNKIYYYREVKMFKGTFPREQYGELIRFYRDMASADKCQAVLTRNEP